MSANGVRTALRVVVAVSAIAAAVLLVEPASSQTSTTACGGSGLPACVTTTTVAPTTTTSCGGFERVRDLGVKFEGDAFSLSDGVFQAGTPVVRQFNGTPAGGFPVPPGGNVPTSFSIQSDGVALGAGQPMLAAIGVQLAQSTTPVVRIDGVNFNANALGVRNAFVVQGTASPCGPGRWTTYFTIGRRGGAVSAEGLGRTGTMILRWSMLGAALLAVGALLVMASRRRRTA